MVCLNTHGLVGPNFFAGCAAFKGKGTGVTVIADFRAKPIRAAAHNAAVKHKRLTDDIGCGSDADFACVGGACKADAIDAIGITRRNLEGRDIADRATGSKRGMVHFEHNALGRGIVLHFHGGITLIHPLHFDSRVAKPKIRCAGVIGAGQLCGECAKHALAGAVDINVRIGVAGGIGFAQNDPLVVKAERRAINREVLAFKERFYVFCGIRQHDKGRVRIDIHRDVFIRQTQIARCDLQHVADYGCDPVGAAVQISGLRISAEQHDCIARAKARDRVHRD